jgi:hypothetical protein
MSDVIYIAMNSNPDYSSRGPTFHSAHRTLEGAEHALYPGKDGKPGYKFTKSAYSPGTWNGPDGFGVIKEVTIHE